MWHVSSRSGVATLRTAIHLLLTYLLTYVTLQTRSWIIEAQQAGAVLTACAGLKWVLLMLPD